MQKILKFQPIFWTMNKENKAKNGVSSPQKTKAQKLFAYWVPKLNSFRET